MPDDELEALATGAFRIAVQEGDIEKGCFLIRSDRGDGEKGTAGGPDCQRGHG